MNTDFWIIVNHFGVLLSFIIFIPATIFENVQLFMVSMMVFLYSAFPIVLFKLDEIYNKVNEK